MFIKKAFITLISTEDYIDGALVLQKSLRAVNSQYPLVVALTEDLYNLKNVRRLQSENIYIEKINRLEYSERTKRNTADPNASVLNTASKIELFRLGWYDKLVYLDADMIVLENVDNLFDYPDGSMIGIPGEYMGFTACMVFEPRRHQYEWYKILLQNVPAYDGNLIGNLWVQCKHPAFQIPVDYCNSDKNKDCKIFHFINNPKPWQPNYENHNSKYDQLFFKYFDEIKNK